MISFRPVVPADHQLLADWLGRPHIQRWWREAATVEHVVKNYDGDGGKTKVFIVLDNDQPIGMVQSFLRRDYPEDSRDEYFPGSVGIDYLIGPADRLGKGLGTALIAAFVEKVKTDFPDAPGVLTDPEVSNTASIRILEKNGFSRGQVVTGEHGPEQLMQLVF